MQAPGIFERPWKRISGDCRWAVGRLQRTGTVSAAGTDAVAVAVADAAPVPVAAAVGGYGALVVSYAAPNAILAKTGEALLRATA